MNKQNWAVIANPKSGKGKAVLAGKLLVDTIKNNAENAKLFVTERRGHAEELCQEIAHAGFRRIVACGGDGTVNEIINGIMRAQQVPTDLAVGIVPSGRCNDLSYALGIPGDHKLSIDVIKNGNVRNIDLGRAGQRYFATIATLGFDSEVSEYVDRGKHPSFLRGTPAYLYAAVIKLYKFKNPTVTLRGEFGQFSGNIFLAATGNTNRYGGRVLITPEADVEDGAFDVCLVKPTSKMEILRMIPKTFNGSHVEHPSVVMKRTNWLQIESEVRLPIWADGERLGTTPMMIQVEPSKLPVIVP